jgi:CHAD domain-containing protein
MAYRLKLTGHLDTHVKQVAQKQVDDATEWLQQLTRRSAVHEARKRLKMLRALVRLVRTPLGEQRYGHEIATIRNAARRLSPVRDADVLLATFDGLTKTLRLDTEIVHRVRAKLSDEPSAQRHVLAAQLPATLESLSEARSRIADWPLRSLAISDLTDGFARSYRRGRRAFREARQDPHDDRLHDWRKRAKDLWYHLRLLRDVWPPVTEVWIAEAHHLTNLLGDDHDLAVLRSTLNETTRDSLRRLHTAIARQRSHLQREARPLGTRMYAEKPASLRRRMRAYLEASAG